ncbi:uncharacterized protein LOC119273292 [Triticum dicoccoides]|uniref:uncharacterized protein LOC119273292 n=1 Tax=Triticum dicoccoides TaxID=85692 RepID=UPI00189015F2|nr:uncharacterized protein LOC119273292 [Triticum dicoccoides]
MPPRPKTEKTGLRRRRREDALHHVVHTAAEVGVDDVALAQHAVEVDPNAETQAGRGLDAPPPDLVVGGHAELGVDDGALVEHGVEVDPDAETQAELGLEVPAHAELVVGDATRGTQGMGPDLGALLHKVEALMNDVDALVDAVAAFVDRVAGMNGMEEEDGFAALLDAVVEFVGRVARVRAMKERFARPRSTGSVGNGFPRPRWMLALDEEEVIITPEMLGWCTRPGLDAMMNYMKRRLEAIGKKKQKEEM